MNLGPVRVMGAGVVVMMCVEEVCTYANLILSSYRNKTLIVTINSTLCISKNH